MIDVSYKNVFDIVPTYRRTERVEEKIQKNEWISASGLVSLAVLNFPEDLRDMKSSYKQLKSKITGEKFEKPYDYKIAQHPFSFFRGTLLHNFVNPKTSPCPKLAKWLLKNDTTIFDTNFCKYIIEKFKIEVKNIETKIRNIKTTPKFISAQKINTQNILGELTLRAMLRTTKLGALALAGIEGVHFVKEIKEGKNKLKAMKESLITYTSSIMGIGYFGAIGAKYFGSTGSLIGMGMGSIIGNKTSKYFNKD